MTQDDFEERLAVLISEAMDGRDIVAGRITKALEQAIAVLERTIRGFWRLGVQQGARGSDQ